MLQRSLDRRHHYKDVEELIDFGVLTHSVNVFGVTVLVRSLFPEEIRDITQRTHQKGVYPYRVWIVSHALYSVGGWRSLTASDIHSSIQRFPKKLVHFLFYQVVGLMNRYRRAMELAQAFAYEPYGRHAWYTNGRRVPQNSFNMMNGIQTLWQFVNIVEDRYEDAEVSWNHSKFIASSMSPKGVKKQQSKDDQAKKKRESEREEYILKSLKFIQTGDVNDKPLVVNAKTDDELMEEYKRWVSGEQDNHDLIVQNYKDRIREGMAVRDAEAAARVQELMGDGERGVFSATRVAGEEKIIEQFSKTRKIEHEGSQKRLYKRFLGREEIGGDFFVDEAGQVRKR